MKQVYSEEFKLEVLEYKKTHTIKETCERYSISSYSLQNWKGGWSRKNRQESNRAWYETHGKDYYSQEENKKKKNKSYKKHYYNNKEKCLAANKKSRDRRLFKKLSDYANRTFHRKDKLDYKLTSFDLWKIAKYQKLICPVSGYKLTKHNTSVDHIIPISKGGTNHPSNIRLVDRTINLMILAQSDAEFFKICLHVVNFNQLHIQVP